jgi:hypothetical protein
VPEILTLLQNIAPVVSATILRQLSQVIYGLLINTGRITMLKIPRGIERGGSYRTIQHLYHGSLLWLQIQGLFCTGCLQQLTRMKRIQASTIRASLRWIKNSDKRLVDRKSGCCMIVVIN